MVVASSATPWQVALSVVLLQRWEHRNQSSSWVMTRPASRVQEVFKISLVELGRVGSGQEDFEISRVGPGHADPTRPAMFGPTREQL